MVLFGSIDKNVIIVIGWGLITLGFIVTNVEISKLMNACLNQVNISYLFMNTCLPVTGWWWTLSLALW
jgi:hypothetical protein